MIGPYGSGNIPEFIEESKLYKLLEKSMFAAFEYLSWGIGTVSILTTPAGHAERGLEGIVSHLLGGGAMLAGAYALRKFRKDEQQPQKQTEN